MQAASRSIPISRRFKWVAFLTRRSFWRPSSQDRSAVASVPAAAPRAPHANVDFGIGLPQMDLFYKAPADIAKDRRLDDQLVGPSLGGYCQGSPLSRQSNGEAAASVPIHQRKQLLRVNLLTKQPWLLAFLRSPTAKQCAGALCLLPKPWTGSGGSAPRHSRPTLVSAPVIRILPWLFGPARARPSRLESRTDRSQKPGCRCLPCPEDQPAIRAGPHPST